MCVCVCVTVCVYDDDDDDDIVSDSVVTPCYCSMLGVLGRVISFEACCQWVLLSVQITSAVVDTTQLFKFTVQKYFFFFFLILLVVAFLSSTLWGSPGMCTYTCTSTGTLHRVTGLRVWPFSITPPCRQPHSIFKGCIAVSGKWGLLCQELTMAEDNPHTRHNNFLL